MSSFADEQSNGATLAASMRQEVISSLADLSSQFKECEQDRERLSTMHSLQRGRETEKVRAHVFGPRKR